jgi:Alginate export
MRLFFFPLLFAILPSWLGAQKSSIHMLRYHDQWQHLASDSMSKTGMLRFKMIPIGSPKNRLSIGGEVREQVQYFGNQNFGDVPPSFEKVSVTQVWHRFMLHANLDLGKKVRLFGQINQTLRLFNPNPLMEIDQNKAGLHQLSLDVNLAKTTQLRIGRQEMSYGNNRLLTFREGPNNRLAFDAAVLKYQGAKWRIDVLVATPVTQKEGVGDDTSTNDWVSGIYTNQTIVPKKLSADYYLLHSTTSGTNSK